MPRAISAPIRLSFAPEPVTPGPGPDYAVRTDEVLTRWSYARDEIDKLRDTRAIG